MERNTNGAQLPAGSDIKAEVRARVKQVMVLDGGVKLVRDVFKKFGAARLAEIKPGDLPRVLANLDGTTARGLQVTIGNGSANPQGQTRHVANTTELIELLRNHNTPDAWWAPTQFDQAYRTHKNAQSMAAVTLDVDYHDDRGNHVPPPDSARAEVRRVAEKQGATLFHHTPRGARLTFLLRNQCHDVDLWERAARAISARLDNALAGSGYDVDTGASCDRARLFWVPKTTVDGAPRAAEVEVVGDVLTLEPADYPEVERPPRVADPGREDGDADDLDRARWGLLEAKLIHPDKPIPLLDRTGKATKPSSYDWWFKVGCACKPFGDAGLALWIDWSRNSEFFDEDEIESKWDGMSGTDPASLFYLFDEASPAWRDAWHMFQAQGVFDDLGNEAVDFPLDALPPTYRKIVERGAAAQGVEIVAWGVPLIGALAAAVVNSRTLRIKSTHREPGIAWIALLGVSGVGKSPPADTLFKPHRERDLELDSVNKAARASYEYEVSAYKDDVKRLKKGEPRPTPPAPPPPIRCATVGDCTIEALGDRLAGNPRGVALVVDELTGWLGSFGAFKSSKAGGSLDASKWLELHAGRTLKIDRKTGPQQSVVIPNAAASIYGTVQPRVLRRALGQDGFESGLAARLFIAQLPRQAARYTDDEVETELLDAYNDRVKALLDLQPEAGGPIDLTLTDDARDLYVQFQDDSADSQNKSTDDEMFSAIAKARGGAARLALLIALASAAERGSEAARELRLVDGAAMKAGIRLAQWFMLQATAIYASWKTQDATEKTNNLVGRIRSWIRRRGVTDFTERDARQQLKRRNDRTVFGLTDALDTMVANSELRPADGRFEVLS